MTDNLAQRFALITDPADDGDWAAVRRGSRRRARLVAGATLVGALVVTAIAMAATGTWMFSSGHDATSSGRATVTLGATTYDVWANVQSNGRYFSILLSPKADVQTADLKILAVLSGTSILSAPGAPPLPLLPNPPAPTGAPSAADVYATVAGEVWIGASRPEVSDVTLVAKDGQTYTTETIAFPPQYNSAFRFWAVAVPGGHARSIVSISDGKIVDRRTLYATRYRNFQ
jgi:hypothetical protein